MTNPVDPPFVPNLPPAPLVTDNPEVFDDKSFPFAEALDPWGQALNALAQATKTNAIAAQEQAQLAATQVGLAADQVQLATAQANAAGVSATSAAGAANYQGDYNPDSTYTVGQSVSYDALRFVAKRTVSGVTPVDGADWLLLRTVGGPTLQGDPAPYLNETKTYQITNYNSFSSYGVSASAGTASISGDTITYTAPTVVGNVSLTLAVDGQPTEFTVSVQPAPPYIPTPTPTPANFGDPLDGGFYAGIVWGQIAQSSTIMAIATGSKTLSVPSMLVEPIVYQGQTVEVRSRSNPTNKLVGTVSSVSGANLTINVTSSGGSGIFSDWSVMARHRIIVAPKASGEHAGIALKNTNTAFPAACQTLTEGFTATQAMRAADSSTVYPAAHWARNLTIGGRTDWYIPARDELEPCWRNLKPVTNNNYVTADRLTGASFNYANNGSYGDTANTHGTNNNSAPSGVAYTASVPGQTAATAFRTGGTEAFEFGAAYYWTCSEYNATGAWNQYWSSSGPGYQNDSGKTVTHRVRAIRRSII